jgi:hypothetical protein
MMRLYRAQLIDRPLAQIDVFRGGGSQPLVYGLDNAGAARLAALDGHAGESDMRGRNRRFTRENLDHTLATACFMVDVELACRDTSGITFIPPDDIRRDGAGRLRAGRWSVSLPWQGHRADVMVAPDAMFGLLRERIGEPPLRSFCFVEVDRGTMTIVPSERVRRSEAFLYRATVLRKLFAYAVSHRERMHHRHLAVPSARVLFLTTSSGRANEMRRAAHDLVLRYLDVPAGLFLFGVLGEPGNPLKADMMTMADTRTQLLGF